MKTLVAISDMQIPFEDKYAVDAVAEFIEDYKPDMVFSVGDENDLAPISRYVQGGKGEWEGHLGEERDRTVEVMGMLQIEHVTRSNHRDRWFAALSRVPAFETIPELNMETFFKFEELGVTYHDTPWDPTGTGNWLLMHGDEGSMNSKAGLTALGLANRTMKSVVCGHTHRAAAIPQTFTYLGDPNPRRLWGFEVGTLADFNSPGMKYAKFKNWQQGFGILHVFDDGTVSPLAVPIENRSFIVDGVRYAW